VQVSPVVTLAAVPVTALVPAAGVSRLVMLNEPSRIVLAVLFTKVVPLSVSVTFHGREDSERRRVYRSAGSQTGRRGNSTMPWTLKETGARSGDSHTHPV